MKLITRRRLGWAASAAPSQTQTRGVKVHYEGTTVSVDLLKDHTLCLAEWKAIRTSHMANRKENYSDVAYNYAACPHGYLLEGRGIGKRSGANGNATLNRQHYAIVALLGDDGLTDPTDAMLHALRDGIELLRRNGAGDEIRGHRDGYATACPGDKLYAWVKRGAPRPAADEKPQKPASKAPEYEPFPGAAFFMKGSRPALGKSSKVFTAMGKRLVAVGCGRYRVGPGPILGQADIDSYQAWQRRCGFTGSDATWPPGRTTWDRLRVPRS